MALETQDMELGDILSFMDGNIPTEEINQEEEEILEENEETQHEEQEREKESLETTAEETEEEEEEAEEQEEDYTPTEEDEQHLNSLFTSLKEEGALEVGDDFEFDGTPESFDKALDATFESLKVKAQEDLLSKLSPDYRRAIKYGLTTNKPISSFMDEPVLSNTLEELDLDSEDNQRYILREHLKSTTRYSDDKIAKTISRIEQAGDLEFESKDAYQDLIELQSKEEERLDKEREDADKQAILQATESRNLIASTIDTSTYIPKARKTKVKNFINNVSTRRGAAPLNGVAQVLTKISKNPEHLVQLADLLLEYDDDKGINYSRTEKKLVSKATKEVRGRMRNVLDPASKMKGKNRNMKSNKDFDMNEWLQHTA